MSSGGTMPAQSPRQRQLQEQQQEHFAAAEEPCTPNQSQKSNNVIVPDSGTKVAKVPESCSSPKTGRHGPSYAELISRAVSQGRPGIRCRTPEGRSKAGGTSSSGFGSNSSTGRCPAKAGTISLSGSMQRATSQPLDGSSTSRSGTFNGKYKLAMNSSSGSSKSANTSPQISPRRRSAVQSAIAIQKLAASLADAGLDDPEVLALAACYNSRSNTNSPTPAPAVVSDKEQQQQQQLQHGVIATVHSSSNGSSPFSPFSAVSNNTTDAGAAWGANAAAAAAAGSTSNGSSSGRQCAAGSSISLSVAARVAAIFGSDSIPEDVTAAAAAAATNIKARAAAVAGSRTAAVAAGDASTAAAVISLSARGVTTRPITPSGPVMPSNTTAAAAATAANAVSLAAAVTATMSPRETIDAEVPAPVAAAPAALIPEASTAVGSSAGTAAPINQPATAAAAINSTLAAASPSAAATAAAASSSNLTKLSSSTTVFDLKKQLQELQDSLNAAKAAGEAEAAGIAAAKLAAAQKAAAAAAGSTGGSRSVVSGCGSDPSEAGQPTHVLAALEGIIKTDWSSAGAAAAPAEAAGPDHDLIRAGNIGQVPAADSAAVSVDATAGSSTNRSLIMEERPVISNNGSSILAQNNSKLETGSSSFSTSSWGSAASSIATAVSGCSSISRSLPLSYEPQIRSNVSDHRSHGQIIDPMLRGTGSTLKSISEQHELLNSGCSSSGMATGDEVAVAVGNSNTQQQQQQQQILPGICGLRIKVRSDSKLSSGGHNSVSEDERSDPRCWANTFFPGSVGAAAAAAAAAAGGAATAAAMDGTNSKLNTVNTTSTGVSLFVTEVKIADTGAGKVKKVRNSSSGDGSSASSGSVWRIGTCSLPSFNSSAFTHINFTKFGSPLAGGGGSSRPNWFNRKFMLCAVLALIVMAAISVGVGAWAGVKQQRHKLAAVAVQQLGFEAAMSVPTADGDAACGKWFATEEHVQLYRRLFAAAYVSALGVQMTADNVMTVTCGGSEVYPGSSSSSSAASRRLAAVAAADDGVLVATAGKRPDANATAAVAVAATVSEDVTASPAVVEILTLFVFPAPPTARESISKAVVAASAGILTGPLSRFFNTDTALVREVKSLEPTAAAAVGDKPPVAAAAAAAPGESTNAQTGDASSVDAIPHAETYTPSDTAAAAAAATPDPASASPDPPANGPASTTAADTAAAAAADGAAAEAKPPQAGKQAAVKQQQQQQVEEEQDFVAVPPKPKQTVRPKVLPSDVKATLLPPNSAATAAAVSDALASSMRIKKPAAAAAAAAGGAKPASSSKSKSPGKPSAAAHKAASAAVAAAADASDQEQPAEIAVTSDTAAAAAAAATVKAATAAAKQPFKVASAPAAKPPAAAKLAPALASAAPEPVIADPVVVIDTPAITVSPTATTPGKKPAAPQNADFDTFSPAVLQPAFGANGEAQPVPVEEAPPVVMLPDAPANKVKPAKAVPAGNTFDPVYTPWGSARDAKSAPSCGFPATKTNSYSDTDGRLWGFANGKDCVFKQ